MPIPVINDDVEPGELKWRFGEEADLYAEVRADAAAASGRCEASRKWDDVAEELREEDSDEDS
jgi:hypothetical protein